MDPALAQERERVQPLPDLQRDVEKAESDLADLPTLVELRRKSVNPGDGVLRSLASFKDGHQNWAAFFGAGCLSQENSNPIGSLNFRLAYLWSIHNRLKYEGPEFAKDGPKVTLLQPELSFTLFVDQRKSWVGCHGVSRIHR